MLSLRTLTIAALLLLATLFAAANLWFAAARSTIPLRLDAVVAGKEIRREKHPPKDDVCLLDLGPRGVLQVDQTVFDRVKVGDRLRKGAWSLRLMCNRQALAVDWSRDARGMLWAMPLALGVMMTLAIGALRPVKEGHLAEASEKCGKWKQ